MNLHNELKKEFQTERMILFSDAIFAIAITLMAIEIKVPVIEEGVTDTALLHALGHSLFKFAGFFISFFIIGLYWTVHHRMFSFVENYTNKLLWLNLLFLLSIVLMPFSSGLYGEYSNNLRLIVPYGFYVFNIVLTGFFNFLLWRYIGNPNNQVAHEALTRPVLSASIKRSLVTPAVFLCSFLIATLVHVTIWAGVISRYMPMLIPVIMRRIQKKYLNKTPVPVNNDASIQQS